MPRQSLYESGNGSQHPGASEWRAFAADADAFLRATADHADESFMAARSRFEERLNRLRQLAGDAEAEARGYIRRRYRQAVDITDRYVHENPWRLIWTAVAAGLISGLLANRIRHSD